MKQFWKTVLTFKFIVSFLALLCLLVIWVWGPEVGLPTRDQRFLASIVVFSVWVLLLLVGRLLGRGAQQTWRNWSDQRQQEARREPAPREDATYVSLRERLLNAIHTLKRSSLGRRWLPFGRSPIYRMPWVVMMGESGAGRTALMKGSDLEFALLEYSPYEENRDPSYDGCEWHFANQAVVMDTHARMAESAEGRVEWGHLLTLLKKYRSKKPLDALVLGIDVARLSLAKPEDIEQQAKQLRDRIHALADQLGFQVPVYVAFTQIDRLEGFEAFFRGANANDLQKPWGAMLSWKRRKTVHPVQAFNTEFDLLASELREMAEQRLLQHRGVSERLGLYSFPIEFAKLKPALGSFIGKLFQTNPYQFRPLLRGFYFTSVTQGGELVSPAGSQIRQAFGLHDGGARHQASSALPRRYFVGEFFSRLVLPDHGLSLRLPWRLERWQKWVLGGTLLAGLLVAAALALSWLGNREAQRALDQRMAQLSESLQSSNDPRDWLRQLDGLRAQAQALDEDNRLKPLWLRAGLFHGDSTRADARRAYFGQFEQQMLNPMGAWLENRLAHLDLPNVPKGSNPAKVQSPSTTLAQRAAGSLLQPGGKAPAAALKAGAMTTLRGAAARASGSNDAEAPDPVEEGYLLFKVYSGLAEPARADTALLARQLPDIWPKALARQLGSGQTLNAQEAAALQRCIDYYLSQLKEGDARPYQAREAVLGSARDSLKHLVTEQSPVKRLYKSIVEQAQSFPSITLAAVLGDSTDLLRGNARVNGLYTRQAWEQFFKPAFEEASKKQLVSDDLLHNSDGSTAGHTAATAAATPADAAASAVASQKVYDELKGYYIDDYAQAWRQFLAGIEVVPFTSIETAVDGLGRLGDLRRSPYVALVQTLDEQTSWDAPTKPIFEEIAGQAQSIKDKLLGKEPTLQRVKKGEQIIGQGRLEAMFAPLVSLVRSPDKGGQVNQSLGRYLEQLQAVRNRLAKIRAGNAQGAVAVTLVKNTLDGVGSEINDAYVWTDQLLTGMDYKTQDAVRPLFMQPILSTWDVVLVPAAIEINTAWGSAVLEPWTQAFAGRYPFVDSAQDASLAELARFVRDKDGLIWSFMRQNFDFLVMRQGTQIVPRQWAGKGLNVRADFLETLNRLARVGEAVALRGEVGFRFYMQPETQPRIASTELELDGQSLKYQNGPQEWRLMSWPGPGTAPQLRVQALVQTAAQGSADAGNDAASASTSASNGTAATVQVAQYQRGPWAFMRALAAARVERLDGGRARISWPTPGGQNVSYLMRNESSYGPQDLALLYGMKLPGQILQIQQAPQKNQVSGLSPAPDTAAGTVDPASPRNAQAQSRQALLQRINQSLAPVDGAQ